MASMYPHSQTLARGLGQFDEVRSKLDCVVFLWNCQFHPNVNLNNCFTLKRTGQSYTDQHFRTQMIYLAV